ncbi:MAG: hypothetical protein K0U93_25805 [Gammaproteobacteria bacterium]|nr:hypothetical protein [Gammaproteobacteria bacterium]
MNSDSYYGYHARVVPDKPIAITGFPGARVQLVGASLTALTGLGLRELDHVMEHQIGQSVAAYVLAHGERALRQLETSALERVLQARPAGIVVLGEGTLLARKNRKLVATHAQLVYVELGIFELYGRVREEMTAFPGRYFHLIPQIPDRPHDLRALFRSREPGYKEAVLTIDAAQKHPTQTAREIIAQLSL